MPKERTCKNKNCKKKFIPPQSMIGWCSPSCGYEYSEQLKEKKEKQKKTEARRELKEFKNSNKVDLKADVQRLINAYARKRDEFYNGKRCCTCGIKTGKMDGGHFLPTSTYNSIRYNVNQIHQQCVKCNRYNYGMPKEYRVFMVDKYGEDYVVSLESTKNNIRLYTIEYYQRLKNILLKRTKRFDI